jgi:hypothetical protein
MIAFLCKKLPGFHRVKKIYWLPGYFYDKDKIVELLIKSELFIAADVKINKNKSLKKRRSINHISELY